MIVVAFSSARYLGDMPGNETRIVLELSDYRDEYPHMGIEMERGRIVEYAETLCEGSYLFGELRVGYD